MKYIFIILSIFCLGNYSRKDMIRDLRIEFPNIKIPEIKITDNFNFPIVYDIATRSNRLAHAVCVLDKNLIVIRWDWWKNAPFWHKKKVFMHEIGHCVFNLGDSENPYEYSIMNRILSTVKSDGSNWNYLMIEFKNRIKNNGSR